MFDRESTRLTRIDWMKYGLSALNPSSWQEPTNEQLKQAIVGMATGFNQFAQELSQLLGGHDIGVKHRAPVALIGYEPDAPGVNDDTEIEDTYPRLMSWSGDSYYDPDDGYAKGGLAGLFHGVVIMRPNVNNVNVNIGGAQQKIVLWGQNGAGARFDNLFIESLYNLDGTAYSGLGALPVGSVILWAGSIGSIPSGWALMDGTANTTGSGIDMRGQIPYGYSGAGDFATIGGTIAIALATSFSGSSTATTSTNGAHGHNVSGTEIAGAIAISAHAASSGSANISTELDIWSIDDSPGTGLEAFDGTNADATFLSGDGFDIQDSGHDHNVLKSAIAGALANHTISDTAATAETDSQGDHTHTVSISTIAGSLSINTPSSVRTPGKVLAFIEKISA